MQDITIYKERANINICDAITMQEATSTLSWLNQQLDTLTADKERLTKPLNQSLKAIREKYKPAEEVLNTSINKIKQAIINYSTEQEKRIKEEEQKILSDKRTNLETKITKLATIDNTATDKVTTDNGSITFTTITKYTLTDHTKLTKEQADILLELNTTALKSYLKQGEKLPEGITVIEEKSLRNYRA